MNIQKVIKNYFAFLLLVVTAAGLSYNDEVNAYYTSVLHSANAFYAELVESDLIDDSATAFLHSELADKLASEKEDKDLILDNENEELLIFEILKEEYFAAPGSESVGMMSFKFTTADKAMELNSIKLKLYGADPAYLLGLSLYSGDELIATTSPDGEYFFLDKLNYKLPENSEGILTLRGDLSPEIGTGTRIRFDIEKPEDMGLNLANQSYKINSFYPIEGEFLSVAKARD